MDKLIRTIRDIQGKLDALRKRSMKETPTRTIVVDPLLEALGWNVRDPDEVLLEYPTVDSKSVDYALLINRKPELLVEAKALDDPLNDVKGITQVVGYAANDGIVWCVLTNGIVWKVYRSVEKCPAPDKLMFEVSLDPQGTEQLPVEQVAAQMWRFSREQMAKGTLDAIGEQTFTDGKVRKALDRIMRDPPRALLNAVRDAADNGELSPQQIRHSLERIWSGKTGSYAASPVAVVPAASVPRSRVAGTGRAKGREKATREFTPYDEAHHTKGKPQEVLELYRAIDRFCLSLKPEAVERRCVAMTINYQCSRSIFCCVRLLQSGIRVWLKTKYSHLESPPVFARDVANLGHYGVGDLELAIANMAQLEEAEALIRTSFESQENR